MAEAKTDGGGIELGTGEELRDLTDPAVRDTIAERARTAARLSIARMRRSGKLSY